MFNTCFLFPIYQKCTDSSTYWQFLYYRSRGKFPYTTWKIAKIRCWELNIYWHYRCKQCDKRYGFSISIGNTSFSPPQMLMCLFSVGILLSCSLFRSILNCDYEVLFFQCHDGCKEALAHFVRGAVQHTLKSTYRKTSLRLGLAVPEVDGPALKVKAGSSITFSQLPKKELWVGDLDGLLVLGWDIAAHPKIAHHSRYVLRMAVRMSTEGVLTCSLFLGDGKFPSQLPDGQSYQERIVNDMHVSAATWAI